MSRSEAPGNSRHIPCRAGSSHHTSYFTVDSSQFIVHSSHHIPCSAGNSSSRVGHNPDKTDQRCAVTNILITCNLQLACLQWRLLWRLLAFAAGSADVLTSNHAHCLQQAHLSDRLAPAGGGRIAVPARMTRKASLLTACCTST